MRMMKMDKTEEIELMNRHLEQLIKLKQSGYRCDQEISKVLGKMHEYMGVDRNQQKFSIESGYGSIAAQGKIISNSDSLQYCKEGFATQLLNLLLLAILIEEKVKQLCFLDYHKKMVSQLL